MPLFMGQWRRHTELLLVPPLSLRPHGKRFLPSFLQFPGPHLTSPLGRRTCAGCNVPTVEHGEVDHFGTCWQIDPLRRIIHSLVRNVKTSHKLVPVNLFTYPAIYCSTVLVQSHKGFFSCFKNPTKLLLHAVNLREICALLLERRRHTWMESLWRQRGGGQTPVL